MATDTASALRLKGMVDSVLRNSNADQRPMEAKSLADAFESFRAETRKFAEERGIAAEFDRLFPKLTGSPPSTRQLFEAASFANEAAALLAKLSGWLDGLVQEARMALEAKAYAEARLQQENH